MGYSPWGHKDLDMTKQLTQSLLSSGPPESLSTDTARLETQFEAHSHAAYLNEHLLETIVKDLEREEIVKLISMFSLLYLMILYSFIMTL